MRWIKKKKPKVFISYRIGVHDRYVDEIYGLLKDTGMAVWLDRLQDEKPSMDNVDTWLRKAILKADVMIFLISPKPKETSELVKQTILVSEGQTPSFWLQVYKSFEQYRKVSEQVTERLRIMVEKVVWLFSRPAWTRYWYRLFIDAEVDKRRSERYQEFERKIAKSLNLPILQLQ